ncbi:hypothetical protein PCCS19_07660 [Paenibacillus sp. CCS19]|uniref:S-layer homology domain-containing protein n=1 Tax=Paenibacillus sp. CCS19 TaxID=3158387 RepID=UPI00256E9115|nr:S-layer homology domain-containing protein [Paenibacillus cellulosilyticus]GMK37712.1 hypothetical protein PCCS19_07660 [Paenibacillus cellulosilyticus]
MKKKWLTVITAFMLLAMNAQLAFAMQPVAEVYYNAGTSTYQSEEFEAKLTAVVKQKLDAVGINPKYVSIMDASASQKFVTDETYVHTGYDSWYGFYSIPQVETADYRHVQFTNNNKTVSFYGYTAPGYKDFMLTQGSPVGKKVITFDMDESKVDYHSMEGGGFLFNSTIDGSGKLSGYAILYVNGGIKVYEINNVDANVFHETTNAWQLSDIQGITLVSSFAKGATTEHAIKIVATDNQLNMWDNGVRVITNLALPNTYGNEFGPLVSYIDHGCEIISIFTYDNMKLYSTSSKTLTTAVNEIVWEPNSPYRYVIDINDNNDDYLGGPDQETLTNSLNQQNVQYVGITNEEDQDDVQALIDQLVKGGQFVNSGLTEDEIIEAIADQIVDEVTGKKDAIHAIEHAETVTQIQYAGYDSKISVTQNLTLVQDPTVTTTWSSDQPSIIAADGTVTRPSTPQGTYVTLKATITQDGLTSEQTFNVFVKGADPAPISTLTASAGDGQATLQFPALSGLAGSNDVAVEISTDGTTFKKATTTETLTSASTSATVTGLTNGTTYYVRLNVGSGFYAGKSNNVQVTPSKPVSNLTAVAGDEQVTLNFPALTGARNEDVKVEISTDGTNYTPVETTNPLTAASTSATVADLANGEVYYVRLNVGSGAFKGLSNAVQVMPSRPVTDLTAVAGDGRATLSFPALTGTSSNAIVVEVSTDGTTFTPATTTETLTAASTSATVTGLTNGDTYYVRLNVGSGPFKGASNNVQVLPSKPVSDLTVDSGNEEVTLNFPALTGTDSKDIVVEISTDGTTFTQVETTEELTDASTSATVADLTNGDEYYVRLNVKSGPFKGTSNIVQVTPSKPVTGLTVVAGDSQVTLNFPALTGTKSKAIVVEVSTDGTTFSPATTTEALTAASTSATLTGLTNGDTYYVRLNVGSGPFKGTSNIVQAAPSKPVSDMTVSPGNQQATLLFPALTGTDSEDIIVEVSTDGITFEPAETTASLNDSSISATVNGLTNNKTYYFRLNVKSGPYAGLSNVVIIMPYQPIVIAPPNATETTVTVTDKATGETVTQDKITKLVGDGLKVTGKIVKADGTVVDVPAVNMNANGTFTLPKLPAGEYSLTLNVYAPNGEKLAGPVGKLTVDSNGVATLKIDLVDPYGTILDTLTKQPMQDATMRLYWADTELNRSKGRTPGTLVNLPELPDFAPNKNHNPQVSTKDGEYGWMVFADGDYYFTAEKNGYVLFDSRNDKREATAGTDSYVKNGIIHIGQTIMQFSFNLQAEVQSTGKHTAYMNGYPDGSFHPENGLTRAEIATILTRLYAPNEAAKAGTTSYSDVSASHWAANAIEIATSHHWMIGTGHDKFEPNRKVTRAEFAQLLLNLNEWKAAGASGYTDTQGHWADGAIATVKSEGLLFDFTDSKFSPSTAMTRLETVRIFNKMLDRQPWQVDVASIWNDVPADNEFFKDIMEASVTHEYELYTNGYEA